MNLRMKMKHVDLLDIYQKNKVDLTKIDFENALELPILLWKALSKYYQFDSDTLFIYRNLIDWDVYSRFQAIDVKSMPDFAVNYFRWDLLSENPNVCFTKSFLVKHMDQLRFFRILAVNTKTPKSVLGRFWHISRLKADRHTSLSSASRLDHTTGEITGVPYMCSYKAGFDQREFARQQYYLAHLVTNYCLIKTNYGLLKAHTEKTEKETSQALIAAMDRAAKRA